MKARPHIFALTPRRGPKAPPKRNPRRYVKPDLQTSHTKAGPGRKAHASALYRERVLIEAPRTAAAPAPRKKLKANVGRNPLDTKRRVWREDEPMHVIKPVRAVRVAAGRAASLEAEAHTERMTS